MTDIKSMFARMNDGGGDAGAQSPTAAKPSKSKKATIEKTYQKKTQLEHILLRPDTYIGSVEKQTDLMWVYDADEKVMVQKNIEYVSGLYKIFDEVLVNAADNKQRDKNMDCIKIDIDPEANQISIWNNGQGIPVVMHKDENMYVPTMIFGHLLTSSNYNDEEEKVTGGRNGYGAKLCNIFSTKFIVETASKEYKRSFKQTWGSNMTKTSEPKIKEFLGSDFTKITFCPDLAKFKMEKLDEGIVGILSRRAFDIAASTRGVKVILNGTKLPVKNFKEYIDLYIKNKEDEAGNKLKVVYENVSERWEVAMTTSDTGFQQVSFVNSIATTKGGRHVEHIADMISKQLVDIIKKKNKGGINITPMQVKNHMWLFVNCLIVNPTFGSQTKEHMTLQAKSFGSKCALSDKFIAAVNKSGIVELVMSWAKSKAQDVLNRKTGGKKLTKLKGIPKLEDANAAGSNNSYRCTLILTEGDSAKSLAVSGLGVIGRDHYGVFPLRGKLLNVREATHKQILENAEINHLIKIIGLQYKKKYNTENDMKSLRYGKVMIMTDQDQDGSHIKGLVINFIHTNWPELLKQNFLEEFITPIVKATKGNQQISFYSLPEFEEWKSNTANHHTFNIKYYKGLGTSTSKEAKEYFTNIARHRIRFRYDGDRDDDHIKLAFSKKCIEQRKEWLTNFMVESKRRKELGLAEKYLYEKDTRFVSYTDFVNLELVLFSNADNVRSIPSMVDGFKPGQRKVLFACLKRNDKKEVKVAQLAGSVAYLSAYHHGEVSLCGTIVNLAQNFVGSNNINLLEPRGQFGTRLTGGKDSASPRYIFTKLSPLTRTIFHPHDDALLKHEYDDNKRIEPVWYIPIIPMVLVNGADGIGTGWMTKIPNYNPRELVAILRGMLDGGTARQIMPYFKNFRGTVDDCGEGRYVTSGEVSIIGQTKVEITELPINTWTQNYKENILEPMLHGSDKVKAVLSDYKEYNTDTTIKFIISLQNGQLEIMEKDGGLHKHFKLQTMINTSSMCAFDELNCLRKFESVSEIIEEFYTLRLKMYQKRKDYLEGMLQAECDRLSAQARFIVEKCSRDIVVENKKRKIIVEELIRRGYRPDPVAEWKARCKMDEEEEEALDEAGEDATAGKKSNADADKEFNNLSEVKKFDYLMGMPMWMLTDERKAELLRQRDNKQSELEILKQKTHTDLWREDLDAFSKKLDEIEEKERLDDAGTDNKKDKKLVAGRKKPMHLETLPSPMAERVAPVIGDDIRKKVQNAVKAKEGKKSRKIKMESLDDSFEAKDEFDDMIKSKKTLKDKLGTPEDSAVGKPKGRAPKKPKDGMKQTTLDFGPKSTNKANGKQKKSKEYDSADSKEDLSDFEDSFGQRSRPTTGESGNSGTPIRERRNVKPTKYACFDSDSDVGNGKDVSDDEQELRENDAIKEDTVRQVIIDSDDEDDFRKPEPPTQMSSDDLFNSLRDEPMETNSSPEVNKESRPAAKKPAPKRKKFSNSSDSDDSSKKTKAKPKKKVSKKRNVSASDDDFDIRQSKDDTIEEDDFPLARKPAGGRARKPTKYYSDSD